MNFVVTVRPITTVTTKFVITAGWMSRSPLCPAQPQLIYIISMKILSNVSGVICDSLCSSVVTKLLPAGGDRHGKGGPG